VLERRGWLLPLVLLPREALLMIGMVLLMRKRKVRRMLLHKGLAAAAAATGCACAW
jgi:hypothetical protein